MLERCFVKQLFLSPEWFDEATESVEEMQREQKRQEEAAWQRRREPLVKVAENDRVDTSRKKKTSLVL